MAKEESAWGPPRYRWDTREGADHGSLRRGFLRLGWRSGAGGAL